MKDCFGITPLKKYYNNNSFNCNILAILDIFSATYDQITEYKILILK